MVGVSDVYSSTAYSSSSSSSSEDEGDRHKNKKASKNLSGLSYFAGDASTAWLIAPAARRVNKVTRNLTLRMRYLKSFPSCMRRIRVLASCLITVTICLKRPRRWNELRASLEDARNRVAELET
jgi:hypothetical protein